MQGKVDLVSIINSNEESSCAEETTNTILNTLHYSARLNHFAWIRLNGNSLKKLVNLIIGPLIAIGSLEWTKLIPSMNRNHSTCSKI
jgi:hypothetical protein